ncbi:uncharacterized protein EV422DRAFT_91696 [Fimicolochytrium jonesii]|uniref:uncharacterized protein n=1 Tax=Fimicolochytrium jonesii TaxID=1396493 RepID=UPI0022FE651F|nr:uncharacterized protein EV422DRAFT_91696 [Fimicolochytrium jonesii]KAI8819919.1 hypothetical protein EV422DRAFT_91696 [Fimicolochytrium jonesii]
MYSAAQYIAEITPAPIRMAEGHSGTSTTVPAWPRTDLKVLEPWTSFDGALTECGEVLSRTDVGQLRPRAIDEEDISEVAVETDLHCHADNYALKEVKRLARFAGVQDGLFINPAGKVDIVCDPDRAWKSAAASRPTLCVEYKTPWAFRFDDLLAAYQSEGGDTTKKVSKAISQLYGYMTFNHHRFGVLSTYTKTWMFERVSDDQSGLQGGVMRVAGPFAFDSLYQNVVLAYLTLFRMVDDRWFYATPAASPAPSSRNTPRSSPSLLRRAAGHPLDRYEVKDVGAKDIVFTKTIDRSNATVAGGTLGMQSGVFKCVDATKRPIFAQQLANEVSIYRVLERLQGDAIPMFYGVCRVWNILHVVCMEFGGAAITPDVVAHVGAKKLKELCRNVLQKVHECGVLHGDARFANFLYDVAADQVKIIDFGLSRKECSDDELAQELSEFEQLDFATIR